MGPAQPGPAAWQALAQSLLAGPGAVPGPQTVLRRFPFCYRLVDGLALTVYFVRQLLCTTESQKGSPLIP
eukprot:4863592-Amphidinium_carterae.2